MGIFSSKPSRELDHDGGQDSWKAQQAVWISDQASKHCQLCRMSFTIFFRRHHCRQCGALVCYDCSLHRAKARGYLTPQRVCGKCAVLLAQEDVRSASRRNSGAGLEPDSSSSSSSSSNITRRGTAGVGSPAPDRLVMDRHARQRSEHSQTTMNTTAVVLETDGQGDHAEDEIVVTQTVVSQPPQTQSHSQSHSQSQEEDSVLQLHRQAGSTDSTASTVTYSTSSLSSSSLPPRPSSRPASPSSLSAAAPSPRSSVARQSPTQQGRRKSISSAFEPPSPRQKEAGAAGGDAAAAAAATVAAASSDPAAPPSIADQAIESLSSLSLFNRLGGFGSLLVLDVRSAEEYKRSHVPRSLNLPLALQDVPPAFPTDPSAVLSALESRLHVTDQRAFRMRQRCTVVVVGEGVEEGKEKKEEVQGGNSKQNEEDFSLTPLLTTHHHPTCLYLSRLLLSESKITSCSILSGGFSSFYSFYPFMTCGYSARELASGKHIHRKPFPGYASIITSYLLLGSKVDSANKEHLAHLGTTHVLNCTKDLPCEFEDEKKEDGSALLVYKRIDIQDEVTVQIKERFKEAFEFLDSVRRSPSSSSRVLVHCQEGISRSPTIVIAYLMRTYAMSLYHSYMYVKGQRKQVFSNLGFWKQLAVFEEELYRERHGGDLDGFKGTLDQCIDLQLLTEEYKARKAAEQGSESDSGAISSSSSSTTVVPPDVTPTPPGASPGYKTLWSVRGVASADAKIRSEEAIVSEAMTPIGPIVTAE